jgi:hypothetical protein
MTRTKKNLTLVVRHLSDWIKKHDDEFFDCNPNLRLATKTRACKGANQEGNSGITSHAPESVGE